MESADWLLSQDFVQVDTFPGSQFNYIKANRAESGAPGSAGAPMTSYPTALRRRRRPCVLCVRNAAVCSGVFRLAAMDV